MNRIDKYPCGCEIEFTMADGPKYPSRVQGMTACLEHKDALGPLDDGTHWPMDSAAARLLEAMGLGRPLTLVPVTRRNMKKALAIVKELFPKESPDWFMIAADKKIPSFRNYIVKCGDNFVGITGHYPAGPCPWLDHPPSSRIWLGRFGILPKYRKQGLGTMLLEASIDKAFELGYRHLRHYAYENKNVAQALLLKRGFIRMEDGEENGRKTLHFELNMLHNCVGRKVQIGGQEWTIGGVNYLGEHYVTRQEGETTWRSSCKLGLPRSNGHFAKLLD